MTQKVERKIKINGHNIYVDGLFNAHSLDEVMTIANKLVFMCTLVAVASDKSQFGHKGYETLVVVDEQDDYADRRIWFEKGTDCLQYHYGGGIKRFGFDGDVDFKGSYGKGHDLERIQWLVYRIACDVLGHAGYYVYYFHVKI